MTVSIGIIGEPAVGKTTVMRKVIDGISFELHKLGKAKWMQNAEHKLIVMGSYMGHTFDGTDRLSMACYEDLENALQYFQQSKKGFAILWEGDRLARNCWLQALKESGYELSLFHFTGELKTVKERRDKRGTKQNESWVSGRRSLCQRLADEHGAQEIKMNDNKSFDVAANLIKEKLHG